MPTGVRVVDRIVDQFDFAGSLTDGHYLGYVSGTGKFTLSAVTVPTAANPSASVGLTAVNGSAGTFLRSDGAPALSQAIAPTWTGVHIFDVNGAASAPPVSVTGDWFTGGSSTTTKPQLLVEPSGTTSTGWSTSGTGLGVNAASGFTGNLFDGQVAGTTVGSYGKSGSYWGLAFGPRNNSNAMLTASGTTVWCVNAAADNWAALQAGSLIAFTGSVGINTNSAASSVYLFAVDHVLYLGDSTNVTRYWLQDAGRTRLTADATNATATMSNLTDLSVTLLARKYTGELVIFADTDVGADGLAIDFDGGTATMTDFRTATDGTPNGATVGTSRSTALATDLTFTTIATYNVVYRFPLSIEVNAAGTFIPRFAQVAHTTGTLTIRKGSHLHLLDSVN